MREERGKIVLRDMAQSDIDDEVRWTNTDNDWMLLDTPWLPIEKSDEARLRDDMKTFCLMARMMPDTMRPRTEIVYDGKHVGFISSYMLDKDWNEPDSSPFKKVPGGHDCIGISICEKSARGKGIGTEALSMYMEYLGKHGIKSVGIETSPENKAMLRVAGKLGFREVRHDKNCYERDGQHWDRLVLSCDIK